MFSIVEMDTIQYHFKDNTLIYKGRYSVCNNPLCTCCNIYFIFDNQNNKQLTPEVRVSLNVREKEIFKDQIEPQDEHFSS